MRLAIGAALVLAVAGTASAATTRKVPADYANIQAAEDACVDGDTILIAKGRYVLDTPVNIDVPNLTIKGAGAIVDGARPNQSNLDVNCFEVYANNVTVTGIKFVNGARQIYSEGASLIVTKCTFVDSSGSSIYLNSGTGARVEGCTILGSDNYSIEGYVTNARFVKNVIRSCDSTGIYLEGAGARFESNTIGYTGDDEGIYNSPADNASVLKNKINNVAAEGIELYGNDVKVEGNTIRQCDNAAGIYIGGGTSAGNPFVSKNKITFAGGGIYVYDADGCDILGNKIVDLYDNWTGVEVQADNMTVIGNSVKVGSNYTYGFYLYNRTATGGGVVDKNSASEMTDAGFYLGYNTNLFNGMEASNLTAVNCGSYDSVGFWIAASDGSTFTKLKATNINNTGFYIASGSDSNTFNNCSVTNAFGDGFRMQSGNANTFNDCTAANCGGEGFDNRGTATVLNGGKYRGDRNDVADSAGGANITLNDVNKVTPGTPTSQVD
jgi:parallel beta-helix repeat protein